jgi:acetyl-CoA synthetase
MPVFNQPIHDNWWQTETGAILIANYAAMDVRPGSMGRPVPGIEAAVLDDNYDPLPPDQDGNLAIRPGWPSMFRTYWNNSEMYNSRFRKDWYITGDKARVDQDGYFWFVDARMMSSTPPDTWSGLSSGSVLINITVAEAGVIGPTPLQ